VIKELYRVCQHGASVNIKIPHPRHDWFITDPTHNRALLPGSFRMLDAEACKAGLIGGDTASALAVYWKVDFELVSCQLVPSTDIRNLHTRRLLRSLAYPFWRQWIKRLIGRETTAQKSFYGIEVHRLEFLSRFLNNVVGEVHMALTVRKTALKIHRHRTPGAEPVELNNVLG